MKTEATSSILYAKALKFILIPKVESDFQLGRLNFGKNGKVKGTKGY